MTQAHKRIKTESLSSKNHPNTNLNSKSTHKHKKYESIDSQSKQDTQINSQQSLFSNSIKCKNLLTKLTNKNLIQMKEIQTECFHPIMSNQNVLIKSPTGTGKTLAYILPLISSQKNAFIVVPTYELAIQIFDLLQSFEQDCGINAGSLSKNISSKIIVCTSGKFNEMNEPRDVLVLDEVDKIIQQKIRIKTLYNQIVLVSATLHTKSIKPILDEYVMILYKKGMIFEKKWFIEDKPNQNIKEMDQIAKCTTKTDRIRTTFKKIEVESKLNIKKYFTKTTYKNALPILIKYLTRKKNKNILIFFNTINSVKFHHDLFKKFNLNVLAISSSLNPKKRKKMMEIYQQKGGILLTTDVLARGFDFKSIKIVIDYECSADLCISVHREGRTGRHCSGKSITFLKYSKIKNRLYQLECDQTHEKEQSGKIKNESRNIKKQMDMKELIFDGKTLKKNNSINHTTLRKTRKKITSHLLFDHILYRTAIDALKSHIKYNNGTARTFQIEKDIHFLFGLKKMPPLDFHT